MAKLRPDKLDLILAGVKQVYLSLQDLQPLVSFGFSPKYHAWMIECSVPFNQSFLSCKVLLSDEQLEYARVSEHVVQQKMNLLIQELRDKVTLV